MRTAIGSPFGDDWWKGLLKKGFITMHQFEQAERRQKETGEMDLGKVLKDLGMVGERECLMARAQEQNIGFIDLDRIQIDPETIACVSEGMARKHRVIPVKKDGGTLWLAMSNDKNTVALDEIRLATGLRVIPVLAVPGAIEDAIKKYYGQPAET